MKQLSCRKTILSVIILMLCSPLITIADPANPGGDPYATPVNGGVVFVVILAFIYGVFRVYQITKKARAAKINR